jgi:hypothetical protein
VPKKNFFPSVLGNKMNDKRNLICGNVILLSQSRGEISLSAFAKKNFGLSQKKNVRSKITFEFKDCRLTRPL